MTLRREDERLLRGRGHFVDDVDRPGQLWMRVVRASVAHARLRVVDLAAARAAPGVHAAVAAADLPDLALIPCRLGPFDGDLSAFLQPPLARGRVRYVGEPVAVVCAEDPYLAEDAADLVRVEYEELPAVLDAQAGAGEDAPALRDGRPNECVTLRRGFGDVEAAFARAAHVVSLELHVGRHSAVPLETRGVVAEHDPGEDRFTLWGMTKVPHFNRGVLAEALGVPPERVALKRSDAGGGFGARGELYPEDVLVPVLARRLGRPVKWIEDRAEHLVACNHSREQRHRIEAAFDEELGLLALRDELWHDNGAYLRTHGVVVAELTLAMLPGPYRVPAYAGVAHVVLTNKTPCGTYRAPGRFEGTFARERLLDAAAGELGVDPLELRRRNLLRPDELPVHRPLPVLGHDMLIDVGDVPDLLERTVAAAGFDDWRAEAAQARADGRLVGCGIGVFMEKSGGGEFEAAAVSVAESGEVEVRAGATSLGQGIETTLAAVAAETLGVARTAVVVRAGDTELLGHGVGSWASRSTVMAGGAVRLAAEATAERARRVAAELLEADPADLRLREGRVEVAGSPGRGLSLGEVAAACDPVSSARRGEAPGLGAERTFAGAPMTYPYGVHLAQIEVDPDTGGVTVRRYFVGYEVGRAITRALVEGQLRGGVAQGVGGTLLEEFRYGDSGQPLAASFMDYLQPTAAEVPPAVGTLIREDAPSPGNPLGAKGAGEGGVTGAGAAVAGAIDDALGVRGGVRRTPMSPERVHALLAERSAQPPIRCSPSTPTSASASASGVPGGAV
jgi:carbon-monoxide dehydrogenase large subunit/6-hydroxypseudooxynicotine dehydrogenase subunit gamma